MEHSAVDLIIQTIQDREYRERFFRDKEGVLNEFRLPDDEARALQALDRRTYDEALERMGAELVERIARGGGGAHGARLASLDYPVIEDYDAG